jgi:hypothetical protein
MVSSSSRQSAKKATGTRSRGAIAASSATAASSDGSGFRQGAQLTWFLRRTRTAFWRSGCPNRHRRQPPVVSRSNAADSRQLCQNLRDHRPRLCETRLWGRWSRPGSRGVDSVVDTYDVADGVETAIRTIKHLGLPPTCAVRLDSGDRASLSRHTRAALDSADCWRQGL